jgi:hypothetical protein
MGNGNTVFSLPPIYQVFSYTFKYFLKRFILPQEIFDLNIRHWTSDIRHRTFLFRESASRKSLGGTPYASRQTPYDK